MQTTVNDRGQSLCVAAGQCYIKFILSLMLRTNKLERFQGHFLMGLKDAHLFNSQILDLAKIVCQGITDERSFKGDKYFIAAFTFKL
jgi:hypothetical protein